MNKNKKTKKKYTRREVISYGMNLDSVREHKKYFNNKKSKNKNTRAICFNIDSDVGKQLDRYLSDDNMTKTAFFNNCAKEYIDNHTYNGFKSRHTSLIGSICNLNTELNRLYNNTKIDIPDSIRSNIDSIIQDLFDIEMNGGINEE